MPPAVKHQQPSDRLFKPSVIPVSREARQLVSSVQQRLDQTEGKRRKRTREQRTLYERAVTALVCDVTLRYILNPDGWVAVELSKRALTPKTRRAPFMTEGFRAVVKNLASIDVCIFELRMGDQQKSGGKLSTIKAAATLATLIQELDIDADDFGRDPALLGDTLELRTAKALEFGPRGPVMASDTLPFPPGADTVRMRLEMGEINSWLSGADLDWHGDTRADQVDLGDRFLKRIFNSGSLDFGGRLYGGFWQHVESAKRLGCLMIDGQPAASLDFAQSALRMAYAKVGVEPPRGDLYGIPGLEYYRREVKQILNALLSAGKPLERFPRNSRGEMPRHWKFERVYDRISRYHEAIVPLFGHLHGLRFMKAESEVLIRALLQLKALDITALPIHDCVLVPWSHRHSAETVMGNAFTEVTGAPCKVEIEGSDWLSTLLKMTKDEDAGGMMMETIAQGDSPLSSASVGVSFGVPYVGVAVSHSCDTTAKD